jgi:ribonuclease Z
MILNRLLIGRFSKNISIKQRQGLIELKSRCLSSVEILEQLPSNPLKRMKSLQMQTKKHKVLSENVLQRPYRIYWQVIGAGNLGASSNLSLVTENTLYMFNCGEGTQRAGTFILHNKSVAQTKNVFITQSNWKNLGGLPGLCLTLRGFGIPKINIHGPPGCMDIYRATKDFVQLRTFTALENQDKDFVDNGLEIQKVQLSCEEQTMPSEIHKSWVLDDADKENEEAVYPYTNCVQAYICKFLPRVGRLNAEKCVDFGVPPGPLFGQLKAGKDITLPDGTIVRSSDVLGDSSPTSSSIVLEIPHTKYLDSLQAHTPKFKEAENLQHIFHFSPPEVAEDPRYRSWMQEFGSGVQHVFLNEACSGIGLMGVRSHQAKLRLMNKELFPPLLGAEHDPSLGYDVQQCVSSDGGIQTIMGKCGLRLSVRPTTDLDMDEHCIYDEASVLHDVFNSPDLKVGDVEEYKATLNKALEHSNSCQSEEKGEIKTKKYPEVSMLGTASAVPGKYRNNTCILVEVKQDHFIILDCGEGSLSQLVRLKGEEGAKRVLRHLKAIFISHQHADHHLGSINLLISRENVFEHNSEEITPLYLVVTGQYRDFLTSYHNKIQPVLSNVQLLKNEDLILHYQKNRYREEIFDVPRVRLVDEEMFQEFLSYTSLSCIETCRALHCRHAFCVTLITEEGFKLTFSGDTRPIPKLVNMGEDSDLLIHEGTMENCLIKDAIIKKHCTFTEAIEVGKDMRAKFTLLTHFSARYSKIPLLDEIENEENVGVAFDNLVVNPDNLHQLRLLYPALKTMFHKEMDEMTERTKQMRISQNVDPDMIPDDSEDRKDVMIRKLNQQYEEKLQNYQRINKWRKDTIDREEGVAKKPPAIERQTSGEISSLINKIHPERSSISPESEERPEKKLSPERKTSPVKSANKSKSPAKSPSPVNSPSPAKSKSPVKRQSPARSPGSTQLHEQLLKITKPDTGIIKPEERKSPVKKRNLSQDAKLSRADISERLLKVAKREAGTD